MEDKISHILCISVNGTSARMLLIWLLVKIIQGTLLDIGEKGTLNH